MAQQIIDACVAMVRWGCATRWNQVAKMPKSLANWSGRVNCTGMPWKRPVSRQFMLRRLTRHGRIDLRCTNQSKWPGCSFVALISDVGPSKK